MFQNAGRPRGRPRNFDESDALAKATQVFWSKGYDGVTIDDLVAGMGVGRPSLYAVFGDKRTIFLRVLRAYAVRRRKCDRERVRPRMSDRLRRAPRRRRRGQGVPEGRRSGRRRSRGTPIPRRDQRRRNPVRLPGSRARGPSHGFRSRPHDARADRHAAQDAPQGCGGSGRLAAPAAPEAHQQAEAITFPRPEPGQPERAMTP